MPRLPTHTVLGKIAILLFSAVFMDTTAQVGVDVPMKPYGTQPALQVLVNGKGPFLFLLDTGANGKVRIDQSVVDQLSLPKFGGETAKTQEKGDITVERVAVETLEIGDQQFHNISGISRSYNDPGEYLPDIGGILAFELFSSQLLTIDFVQKRIRLHPGELPPADGQTVLDYEERSGTPYISVEIGGTKISALIDTGSDRSFDLPTSILRKLPLATYPHPVGKGLVRGREVGIGEVELDVPVRIGRHTIRRPLVTFSESFDTPIIGAVFLHGYVLTFDQKNHRVQIERPNHSTTR